MATRFFRCRHCGNVVEKSVDSGVPLVCCGEKMEELKVNTVEASVEKHLPVVERIDSCKILVKVGSQPHPMEPEHHICFIALEGENGIQRINLKERPQAEFCIGADKPVAVYAYCNLHGLWMTPFVIE